MQAVLENGSPAVEADEAEEEKPGTGIVAKAAGGAAIGENYSKVCTITEDNTSDQLIFDGVDGDGDDKNDGIPLGYYLVNPTYPPAAAKSASLGEENSRLADFEKDTETGELIKDENGSLVLTDDAKARLLLMQKIP